MPEQRTAALMLLLLLPQLLLRGCCPG